MNRRGRGSSNKLIFEPKIEAAIQEPSAQESAVAQSTSKSDCEKTSAASEAPQLRGLFAPQTFATPRPAEFGRDPFILRLPPQLHGASLVAFADGTFALRKDGRLHPCDCAPWGENLVVQLEDEARRVTGNSVQRLGRAPLLLTAYPDSGEDNT